MVLSQWASFSYKWKNHQYFVSFFAKNCFTNGGKEDKMRGTGVISCVKGSEANETFVYRKR